MSEDFTLTQEDWADDVPGSVRHPALPCHGAMRVPLESGAAGPALSAAPPSAESLSMVNWTARWWLILLLVWSLSAVYAGTHLKRGWVPHDEGAFAQSADRVLRGQLPHRDYTEGYTGGLTYLHAFAFHYFGENLATLRYVLFVFFLAWVSVVYWIGSQLVADWAAGGVTLLAVAWSLPNYSAAVPSWYNLFFATFAAAALLAFLRDRARKWLFLAGICGGFSFLAKSVALYAVAAALLNFLFFEQNEVALSSSAVKGRGRAYSLFVVAALALFILALAGLVHQRDGMPELVNFVLPGAALAFLLMVGEIGISGRRVCQRFASLLRMVVPFFLGFALPVVVYLLPYVHQHALGQFLNGTFVLPFKHVVGAFMPMHSLRTMRPVLYVAAAIGVSSWVRGIARWVLVAAFGGLSAYYLAVTGHNEVRYLEAWHMASWVIPPLAVIGVITLQYERWKRGRILGMEHRQLFVLLSVATLCSLVQFPFAAPIYWCYVAPLVILAATALFRVLPSVPRPLLFVLSAHFLLFVMLRVTPGFIYAMGRYYEPDTQTNALDLPRAGKLRVDEESADIYMQLIPLIQMRAGTGKIYAAPDCPEIYFLSGYQNPTTTLFEFLENSGGRAERILRMIDSREFRVVVVKRNPYFSRRISDDLYDALAERFPEKTTVGAFEVRWRP